METAPTSGVAINSPISLAPVPDGSAMASGATQSAISAAIAALIRAGIVREEKMGSTIIAPEILVNTRNQPVHEEMEYSNSSAILDHPPPSATAEAWIISLVNSVAHPNSSGISSNRAMATARIFGTKVRV